MKVTAVIPARFGSTRFPGKPLVPLLGVPLVEWVMRASVKYPGFQKIILATDHKDIARLADRVQGVEVVMTDSRLPSGTDRAWAAIQSSLDCDVIVNIQGDEPLLQPAIFDSLLKVLEKNSKASMATLGRSFLTEEDFLSVNTAKVLLNQKSEAIYFSRLPIPFSRPQSSPLPFQKSELVLKHIGLYAFRKEFLKQFCQSGPSVLEVAEGLEQLRALSLGATIGVAQVDFESWGVDRPEDVSRVESALLKRGERHETP